MAASTSRRTDADRHLAVVMAQAARPYGTLPRFIWHQALHDPHHYGSLPSPPNETELTHRMRTGLPSQFRQRS